jgi:DNA-binding transcriptional LysR family regulator
VIRIDPPQDEQLVGRRILGDERLIVAAPTISIPMASGSDADGLPVPAVVRAATPSGAIWNMETADGGSRVLRPVPVLRFSSLMMVRDAVLQGVGAAVLPKLLVEQDVSAGRLVCWGTAAGAPVEIWALYHSRRLLSAKVREFMNMLQDLSRR